MAKKTKNEKIEKVVIKTIKEVADSGKDFVNNLNEKYLNNFNEKYLNKYYVTSKEYVEDHYEKVNEFFNEFVKKGITFEKDAKDKVVSFVENSKKHIENYKFKETFSTKIIDGFNSVVTKTNLPDKGDFKNLMVAMDNLNKKFDEFNTKHSS